MIPKEQIQFNFFINTEPKTAQTSRMQFNTKTGAAYPGKKFLDIKAIINYHGQKFMEEQGWDCFEGCYFVVQITVCKQKPKSYKQGKFPKSGDCDNFMKVIGDALQGVIWENDNCIIDSRVIKVYHECVGYHIECIAFPDPYYKPKKKVV